MEGGENPPSAIAQHRLVEPAIHPRRLHAIDARRPQIIEADAPRCEHLSVTGFLVAVLDRPAIAEDVQPKLLGDSADNPPSRFALTARLDQCGRELDEFRPLAQIAALQQPCRRQGMGRHPGKRIVERIDDHQHVKAGQSAGNPVRFRESQREDCRRTL